MAHSIIQFDSYDKFSDWVLKHDPKNAAEIISHEKSHFDKSISLGYTNAKYAVFALFESDGINPLTYLIDYPGREPTDSDLIEICLAPDKPGDADLILVQRLRKKLSAK